MNFFTYTNRLSTIERWLLFGATMIQGIVMVVSCPTAPVGLLLLFAVVTQLLMYGCNYADVCDRSRGVRLLLLGSVTGEAAIISLLWGTINTGIFAVFPGIALIQLSWFGGRNYFRG